LKNSIIGISHLVFTVGCDNSSSFRESDFLNTYFSEGEYFEFDHSDFRNDLIRDKKNSLSKLSLFKSKFNDLPAVELLHTESTVSRPNTNFGLLHSPVDTVIKSEKTVTINFPGTDFYATCYYDEALNTYIAAQTNLYELEKQSGCWIVLDDNDFVSQKTFFKTIDGAKILAENEGLLIIKCRVLNKKFSNFVFVLIRDTNEKENSYYNDDQGLSTLGWFTKSLEQVGPDSMKTSPKFSISLNGNTFDARFIYNNQNISHELLKLN